MTRHVVLLRGVNLGSHNRVAMPRLRELLAGGGFADVRTYLQSGNVVLSSPAAPAEVARECERLIAGGLGVGVDAVARSREELAAVVAHDPLGEAATDPKRYQVSFLAAEPPPGAAARLAAAAAGEERFVLAGREIYAWHPHGIGRSRLASLLGGSALGVPATARNWQTVTALLALADEEPGDVAS